MEITTLEFKSTSSEGEFLHLRGPDGSDELFYHGDPVGLVMLGKDSQAFREASSKLYQQTRRSKNPSFEVAITRGTKLISACIKDFVNIPNDNGSELQEFSEKSAFDLLQKFEYIREQADDFITDRSNFLTNSGKD